MISYTAPRQISAPSVHGWVLGKKAENIQPNFGIYMPLMVEPLARLLQNFDALCMEALGSMDLNIGHAGM